MKNDLPRMVTEALSRLGGSGTVVDVCREVWHLHESELRASGDLFFTWQYDIRWAAQRLRNEGQLAPTQRGPGSRWSVTRQAAPEFAGADSGDAPDFRGRKAKGTRSDGWDFTATLHRMEVRPLKSPHSNGRAPNEWT